MSERTRATRDIRRKRTDLYWRSKSFQPPSEAYMTASSHFPFLYPRPSPASVRLMPFGVPRRVLFRTILAKLCRVIYPVIHPHPEVFHYDLPRCSSEEAWDDAQRLPARGSFHADLTEVRLLENRHEGQPERGLSALLVGQPWSWYPCNGNAGRLLSSGLSGPGAGSLRIMSPGLDEASPGKACLSPSSSNNFQAATTSGRSSSSCRWGEILLCGTSSAA